MRFYDIITAILGAPAKEPIATAVLVANALVMWHLRGAAKQFKRYKEVLRHTEDTLRKTKTLSFRNDPSRAWTEKEGFFKDICDRIDALDDQARVQLHIYRGYDQGKDEPNKELQQTILRALRSEKIEEFHRVVVVTRNAFIRTAVEWMIPFFNEEAFRKRCFFYVAFRQNFNLGSYVALGEDQCFIAMPRLDPFLSVPPSTTQSGIFAEDPKIANIIRHYIDNIIHEASNPDSIHGIDCPVEDHRWGRWIRRRALQKRIADAFAEFRRQSNPRPRGSRFPASAPQTEGETQPPVGMHRFFRFRSRTAPPDRPG